MRSSPLETNGYPSETLRLNPRVTADPGLYSVPGAARLSHEAPGASLAVDALLEAERTFLEGACASPLTFSRAGAETYRISGPTLFLEDALSTWTRVEDPGPGRILGTVLSHTLERARRRTVQVPLAHGRTLDLSRGTRVMGILNLTPDSFSDGGLHPTPAAAVDHGLSMVEAGATLLDIGGESTSPGAPAVDAEEELRRVIPVVEALRDRTDALLSVDTSKARVAGAAVKAGVHLVNDVTALRGDPDMAGVVAESGAAGVLMHMRGTPRTMQVDPVYQDVVAEILGELRTALLRARAGGLPPERTLVDPGIGFGKRLGHNLEVLHFLPVLRSLGRPLVLGASRKSFLGHLTGISSAADRISGSLGITALAVAMGVEVIRVHDVEETVQVVRVAGAVAAGRAPDDLATENRGVQV